MTAPLVLGIDWGTTSMRAWAIADDGAVLGSYQGQRGMKVLSPNDDAAYKSEVSMARQALGLEPATPTIICGMAGAAQGWIEAPYCDCPARLDALPNHAVQVPNIRVPNVKVQHGQVPNVQGESGQCGPIYILPGVCQRSAGNQDVMRGEETILMGAGLDDGLVCLPGTHAKWTHLRGRAITGFSTFMTGELFDLLAKHSILQHFVQSAPVDPSGPAFSVAVQQAYRKPAQISHLLFTCRALPLVEGLEQQSHMASRLSGLLIGLELSAQSFPCDGDGAITLASGGPLELAYASAMEAVGLSFQRLDAVGAVQNGLYRAAKVLLSSEFDHKEPLP